MARIAIISCLCLLAQCGPATPGAGSGRCGDGLQQANEGCDDGNTVDADACTNACQLAVCGDGVQRTDLNLGIVGAESCDDGNDFDGDACLSNCEVARCGDGQLRTDIAEGEEGYEACDDGNEDSWDGCTNTCAVVRCGDGEVQPQMGEACDDGNTIDTDA